LIEQPAHERRADVTGVEDEVDRPRIERAARRIRDAIERKPRSPRFASENAIVEEAGGAIRAGAELDQQGAQRDEIDLVGVSVR